MLATRKRPLPLLAALTLILLVAIYHRDRADRLYHQWSSSIESHPMKLPANATLGFGAVVVVSKPGSDRRHTLLQAANVTDIELTIPAQPQWTERDVDTFINGQDKVQRGSILAWLGHHNALRWFLDSGHETALILEDDVDWDIRLRSIQIPLAASAARQLLPPQRSHHPFANFGSKHVQYWGNHDDWDLLYLGHCGDYFEEITEDGPKSTSKRYNLTGTPHVLYKDYTLPMRSDLHPFTQSLFGALQMPAHSRVFHRSKFPLCSFGYAVTRPAAERLLNDLAPPKLRHKGPRAFDVSLLHSCNKGSKTPSPTVNWRNPKPHPDPNMRYKYASPGLRCWTLNSELFHHMPGQSEIAEIGARVGEEEAGIPPVDLAGQAQVIYRNETTNIDCGFWSGAFAFDETDTDELRTLQQKVGKEGKCLKQGRRETDDTLQKLMD